MRYLIGERHRRVITGFIDAAAQRGGNRPVRMLEFGSGTSSHFFASTFAERWPGRAELLSVEHDPAWFARVREMLQPLPHARQVLAEPTGTLGPNASAGEERPDLLRDYIHAADDDAKQNGHFDVILVDGVARNACIKHARSLLTEDGVLVIHDAQRPWYDEGKGSLTAWGHSGSCPDYPGPHLWWGGSADAPQHRAANAEMPLIVSYYTKDTPYEDEARDLMSSLDALGLEHRVESLPVTGSWIENCGRKARVIRDAWHDTGRPVLWLDADARVHSVPSMLAGTDADFAIRCHDGWQFNAATLLFNSTPLGGLLLDDWVHRVETEPAGGEQIHLDRAWEALSCRAELTTHWLPPSYATIFDEPGRDQIEPVIEQFQASRRLAPEQQTEDRVEVHNTEARIARLARRPMEHLVEHTWKHPDVPQYHAPPGYAGLPEAVKLGMLDRVALELLNAGVRSVALYGAGRLARRGAMGVFQSRGIEVVAVIDDSSDVCSPIAGLTPVSAERAQSDEHIEAVIVCSDAHEAAIAERAESVFTPVGVPVLRVFNWRAGAASRITPLRAV